MADRMTLDELHEFAKSGRREHDVVRVLHALVRLSDDVMEVDPERRRGFVVQHGVVNDGGRLQCECRGKNHGPVLEALARAPVKRIADLDREWWALVER